MRLKQFGLGVMLKQIVQTNLKLPSLQNELKFYFILLRLQRFAATAIMM